MTKQAFLTALRIDLRGLPPADVEERVGFYAEMIDDRMEDGLAEEEAVAAIGSPDEIAAQIIADTPLTRLVSAKMKSNRRPSAWEIVLLVLGFPLWFSLLVAAVAVVFSLYVSVWAVIVSLWAVFVSLAASSLGVLAGGIIMLCTGHTFGGLICIAATLVCGGLSVFAFYGCHAVGRGAVLLTQKMVLATKKRFMKKEAAE